MYMLFDEVLQFFNTLLEDIKNASKSIYIEIFKFGNGHVTKRIISELIRAARRGIDVRLLVDDWGTPNAEVLFAELIASGGTVQIWEKFHFSLRQRSIVKSHKRNHRKIITIDNQVAYIGSANITDYSLSWRETILRVHNQKFTEAMKRVFLQYFYRAKRNIHSQKSVIKPLYAHKFEILRDEPSMMKSNIRKRYIELIESANTSVTIETPYFLPGILLRKAIDTALNKGVLVTLIVPLHSDVPFADILRRKYLGDLHEKGVEIQQYTHGNLHAKTLYIDEITFAIGSSNFDYRSFRFQHEITVIGKHPPVSKLLKKHIIETLKDCISFDYELWKSRSNIDIIFEKLLFPFRHLF
jgi:cardiolipin synthase